ncbi:hypothetical protein QMK17_16910 [Rhodococcus sp. G-MC3]|uniref:hypothetical protein n=1 Tax=Rhodococcus sp. G-MC3 TaxID=3046209 RepID=UPI0024B99526|nr:hypothetical protein [Rhodococcus sp. G-MC3]MDJ0395007.1 hypothetical protein [Rhodococcus sp. G-MC3]
MTTLRNVMDDQRAFAIERDWGQFHTPKNLAMALGGELGELSSAVVDALESPGGKVELSSLDSVTSEIADVTLYLLRLFDVLGCTVPEDQARKVRNVSAFDQERAVLVALANLVGTIGAVLEIWQWSEPGDNQTALHAEARIVAALRGVAGFAELVGVELADVASAKLARNAERYPINKCYGSNVKYTEFE